MSQATSLEVSRNPSAEFSASAEFSRTSDAHLLSKVIYRSRPVQPLSPLDLYKLTLAAQSRNRSEAVTGVILYDRDSFFQWLEGPADSLERIMRSIRNDPRHTDIEILDSQSADARRFSDWSMKLATTGETAPSWRRDVVSPPQAVIDDLRRHPEAAPVLLAALIPLPPATPGAGAAGLPWAPLGPLNRHVASVLKQVIRETVLPELARRHGVAASRSRMLPMNRRAFELADVLIAADHAAAFDLIRELQAETASTLVHYATLFEPAARRLGDLWSEDACSEFDVALGLSRIQRAVRLLSPDLMRRRMPAMPGPVVLIAPEPGESHQLGAALDSEVLCHVGWTPQCEYPADDRALQDLLAGKWFDVLDLSLSVAFRREHWLPRLATTIAMARRASLNPALAVVVGGRMFAERRAVGRQVGADLVSITAVQVDQSIMQALHKGA